MIGMAMRDTPQELTLHRVDPLHPDAIFLLHEAAREIRPIYDENFGSHSNLPTNEPAVPGALYLVARLAGTPVGSAALRPLTQTSAEVRRMYVLPKYRRQQIARTLLAKVETAALEFGYTSLFLETGNRQLPAISLYESCGYEHIPGFGEYADDPTSVCFKKNLITQAP